MGILAIVLAIAPADAGRADRRPAPELRKLASPAVEAEMLRVAVRIGDPVLRGLWIDCFPNTLGTTLSLGGSDAELDTFLLPAISHAVGACLLAGYRGSSSV